MWRGRSAGTLAGALVAMLAALALGAPAQAARSDPTAHFSYPQDGLTTVDTSRPFSWSAAPDAQAYRLQVGSSQGGHDLVNSDLGTTSYPVPPLPVGRTLWARVWSKLGGSWSRWDDVSFQVTISASRLTNPRDGQTDVDTRHPLTWSAAPDAQAYSVSIGSSPGAGDLFSTGTTTATSATLPPLPVGRVLYARLSTKIAGTWSTHTDISFTAVHTAAQLTYPNLRHQGGYRDTSQPITWTPVPGATAYSLWIGTSPGASDVLRTARLSKASDGAGRLPAGGQLWARVWTLAGGAWAHSDDVPFRAQARLLSPAQQAISFDRTHAFSWAPASVVAGHAPSYQLQVGTAPGAGDLFNSGTISGTSVTVPPADLPAGRTLYARLSVVLGDGMRLRADNAFTTSDTSVDPSQMQWGPGGSASVDMSRPLRWTASDLAQAYRLQILDGSSTVADSGAVRVPEYFDEALAPGTYTARVGTELGGSWSWAAAPFTVTANGSSATNEIAAAHWAADYVRHMSDAGNWPYAWTELSEVTDTTSYQPWTACVDYANELLRILRQMNITASQTAAHQPQIFNTYFSAFTGHTMVQFWNADDQDWVVMDPTFAIAMKRVSDGHWATIADAHGATVNHDFSAIQYIPLGDFGFRIATGYYIDYPLLYLNPPGQAPWLDPMPYMSAVDPLPSGRFGVYAITADENPVTVLEDGVSHAVTFSPLDPLSRMFQARTIAVPGGSSATVTAYRPRCYVFTTGTFCGGASPAARWHGERLGAPPARAGRRR